MTSTSSSQPGPQRRSLSSADLAQGPIHPGVALLLALFIWSYIPPGNITIGSITMGFPRLILAFATIPCTIILLTSSDIKRVPADFLILGAALWQAVSVFKNNGFQTYQFVGIQLVEIIGAYTFARVLLRGLPEIRLFLRHYAWAMIFILPIAWIELLTERFILHDLLSPFMNTFENATIDYPRRLGFDRVQGNLEHPILYGIFWALGMSMLIAVFEKNWQKLMFVVLSCAAVFPSLSSGAFLVILLQLALMTYGRMTKNNWKLLLIAFGVLFLVVEILSDRPALVAISTRLAFSSGTAYWRVLIFEYGMDNVANNPIFGLGRRPWVRPHWMPPSVDNHWLLMLMRSGWPCFLMLVGAFANMFYSLCRRKDLSDIAQLYRRNYVIGLVSVIVALGSVAVWSGTQAFLWVLLAMGINLSQLPAAQEQDAPEADEVKPRLRYTRFAPKDQKFAYRRSPAPGE